MGAGNMKKIMMGLFLLCSACFGPKPEVRDQKFQISKQDPGAYEVQILVENMSSGEGDAKVKVRLIDTKTQISYRQEKSLELKAHEKSNVILLVRAPEGSYELQSEAEYPAQ